MSLTPLVPVIDNDLKVVGNLFVQGGMPQYDARAFDPGPWDGSHDNFAALQAMVDSLSYGIIQLPPLLFLSQRILIDNKTFVVRGQIPSNPNNFGTLVKVATGQTAFEIRNGTNGRGARSLIEGLHIFGSDSAPGTNPGLRLSGNSVGVRDCVVEGFGGDGIYIRSGSVADPFVGDGVYNANAWRLDRVRCYSNKRRGLFVEGIDSNAGLATMLDCTGNTDWGIYDRSAFGNVYEAPHLDGNTAGAIRIGDQSGFNRFLGIYKEGDSTPALQIDAGGDEGNVIDFRVLVGNVGETIVDNTAGKGNQILLPGGVPRVRAYNSIAVSCASGAFTKITFDSERYDSAAIHSVSSNTSRLVAPVPGWYSIGAAIELALNATGARYCRLLVNNATEIVRVGPGINVAADVCYFNPRTTYFLNAGDYVEVEVYQNSGGALNANKQANFSPEFWMERVA